MSDIFVTYGKCGKKLNPTDSIVDHMRLEHPKEWKEFLRQ